MMCVTKEQYRDFIKKGTKRERIWNFKKVTKSIGDDLDDFCDKIADNKLENITGCNTFQLSLLTAHQKRYLELKKKFGTPSVLKIQNGAEKPLMFPEIFQEIENVEEIRRYFTSFLSKSPDVPEAEMARSESDSKYCVALCTRYTYILGTD